MKVVPDPAPLFASLEGPNKRFIDWAYAGYDVQWRPGEEKRLYLFNVLVAVEWKMSPGYFQQLQAAFRLASDLLYDVTNGLMAFGQVIFGGESWMDFADIQITSSNQTLPRSWVSGLLDPDKYNPIRIGRGAWVRNQYEVIPWVEAEGYHAIVHEWAHYALGNRDEYLPAELETFDIDGHRYRLVIPTSSPGNPSIMSTPQGRSELGRPPIPESISRAFYPGGSRGSDEGPWRLPLPLPDFRVAGELLDLQDSILESLFLTSQASPPGGRGAGGHPEELHVTLPANFKKPDPKDRPRYREDWSVYVLHADDAQGDRILGQGLLDARAEKRGELTVLGRTRETDTILLIGKPKDTVEVRRWQAVPQQQKMALTTPLTLPFVDVIPVGDNPRTAGVIVRAESRGDWKPFLFPRGKANGRLSEMDGYVLLHSGQEQADVVCDYSRGGSPCSCYTVPTNPLSAGAADGGALIFGHSPDKCDANPILKSLFERIVVVTTSIPWVPEAASAPHGSRAISNVFSIASNFSISGKDEKHLPEGLYPTLTIYYDPSDFKAGEVVRIHHWVDAETKWEPLPTHVPPGSSFVSAPLNEHTAAYLIDESVPKVQVTVGEHEVWVPGRVERFCLFAMR